MAELLKMSDQFQGLPMDVLIGGPLTAASDSQVKLARATADFIKMIGFLPPSDDEIKKDPNAVGDTRIAQFKFKRPVELPTTDPNSSTPTISEEEVDLEVPLLAIINVPNLTITNVDITFDMEVKSSFSVTAGVESSHSVTASASAGWGPFSAKASVTGKVSAHAETTRKSDNSAKYHVSVHAEDRGMPEGMARVMDILQTSIAPRQISATPQSPAISGGSGNKTGPDKKS